MVAVDHRDGHQVVLRDEPCDLLLVGLRGDAHRLLLAQEPDRGRRVGRDQPPPGQAAHEMVVVVHHIEDRGGLGHRRLPDLLDRLGHRDVLEDREHVRGHETSGGLFAVLEEPLDLLGLLLSACSAGSSSRTWAASSGRIRSRMLEISPSSSDVRGVGVLEDLVEALAASRLQQIPDGVGEPDRLAHDDGTRRGAARGPAASVTAAGGRAGPR